MLRFLWYSEHISEIVILCWVRSGYNVTTVKKTDEWNKYCGIKNGPKTSECNVSNRGIDQINKNEHVKCLAYCVVYNNMDYTEIVEFLSVFRRQKFILASVSLILLNLKHPRQTLLNVWCHHQFYTKYKIHWKLW